MGMNPFLILLAHFAFYDVFNRIIQITTIEIGDVDTNELVSLKLNEEINSSSVGFVLFSESDKFYSDSIDCKNSSTSNSYKFSNHF